MVQSMPFVPRAFAFLLVMGLCSSFGSAAVLGKKDKKVEAYVPGAGWEAYIHDNEGQTRALAKPIEATEDKDWMFLRFTDYKGPRSRLAVMQVENTAPGGWSVEVPLSAIEELLTTSLFNTNRFDITERKAVQSFIGEQDFGASGRVSEQTAAKVGKVLGADYLIFVAVNEWTPVKESRGAGIGGGQAGLLGGIGAGKTTAEVALSTRIVDATSGQVIFASTDRAKAGSWGISLGVQGGPASTGGGLQRSSPIGYAVQSCINKAAYRIAMSLKDRPWTGTIIKVEGDKVYINAGSNKGMQMGTKLTALSKGDSLTDLETGLTLGEDTKAIGNLQVTTVKENFSIATIVQGCDGLKMGDRVEASTDAL